MNLDDARNLCLAVAPELPDLYLLPEHPAELPRPDGVVAYCVTKQSPTLKDVLVKRGEWRMPAPSIVFLEEFQGEKSLGLVLHELAHTLPFRIADYFTPLSAQEETECRAAFTEFVAEPVDRSGRFPKWVSTHGKDFIRVALHLWWRAALLGHFVDLQELGVGGRGYDLSPVDWYFSALGSEPVRMQRQSFGEILATEPPTLFSNLWIGDVLEWMQGNKQQVSEISQ
jgi:hypothetical protein